MGKKRKKEGDATDIKEEGSLASIKTSYFSEKRTIPISTLYFHSTENG